MIERCPHYLSTALILLTSLVIVSVVVVVSVEGAPMQSAAVASARLSSSPTSVAQSGKKLIGNNFFWKIKLKHCLIEIFLIKTSKRVLVGRMGWRPSSSSALYPPAGSSYRLSDDIKSTLWSTRLRLPYTAPDSSTRRRSLLVGANAQSRPLPTPNGFASSRVQEQALSSRSPEQKPPQAALVYKFGGAALSTPDQVRQASDIIAAGASQQPLVVVLSAMAKTTNALEAVVRAFFADVPTAREDALVSIN